MTAIDYAIACFHLLTQFVQRQITAEEFEREFLGLPRQYEGLLGDELYAILGELFLDVDAYWHECTLETETNFEISEVTLRKRAHQHLRDLTQYLEDKDLLPDS